MVMTDPAPPMKSPARTQLNEGDPFGVHRSLEPLGVLPQPAWRVDNDFSRIFAGELLLSVDAHHLVVQVLEDAHLLDRLL